MGVLAPAKSDTGFGQWLGCFVGINYFPSQLNTADCVNTKNR